MTEVEREEATGNTPESPDPQERASVGEGVLQGAKAVHPRDLPEQERRQRMRELGEKGRESRAKRRSEGVASSERLKVDESVLGMPLRVLEGIANDDKAGASARVQASRAVAELRSQALVVEKPRTVKDLEAMDDAALDELIRTLESEGHGLPAIAL